MWRCSDGGGGGGGDRGVWCDCTVRGRGVRHLTVIEGTCGFRVQ